MIRSNISHALGLHMHQPPGNLRLLIETNPWEAEQIVRCYERAVRYALEYRDVARLHIGFSGVLLEQLLDPEIVDLYRPILDIPQMLERYREADNIEQIGMGYYHPIFPLVPQADWPEQLALGREIAERAFGRAPRGFWPPEMAFTAEMIPALVEAGYDYVVVDGVHVRPEDGISDVFRPYLACHAGVCIAVVPRDRDVSNAQESGLDPNWFQNEVRWRVGGSPRPDEPRLVTTWSDGENGGWFRQTHEGSGFFGHFFAPYMEHYRGGEYPIAPVLLSEYLERVPPVARALVQTGAWNVGANSGFDLSQWAGSERQREAVAEVERLSARYWRTRERVERARGGSARAAAEPLARARRFVLEAETSCFLFWGDAWIPHLYERSRPADALLDAVESALGASAPEVRGERPAVPASEPAAADDAGAAAAPATTAEGAGREPAGNPAGNGGAAGRSAPPRPRDQAPDAPAVAEDPAGPQTPGAPPQADAAGASEMSKRLDSGGASAPARTQAATPPETAAGASPAPALATVPGAPGAARGAEPGIGKGGRSP